MLLGVMESGSSIPELQEAAAHIVVVEAVDELFLALCRLHFASFEGSLGYWSRSCGFHTSLLDMISEGGSADRMVRGHCNGSSAGRCSYEKSGIFRAS